MKHLNRFASLAVLALYLMTSMIVPASATNVSTTPPEQEVSAVSSEVMIDPDAPEAEEPNPEADPQPLTPDGNATLVDVITDENGKSFYTISTENGNTFYMILDSAREDKNVYLLSAVDENDLMDFVEQEEESTSLIPEPVIPEPVVEQQDGVGYAPLVLLAVAGLAGAYYIKVYKPKHQQEPVAEQKHTEAENEDDTPIPDENPDEPQSFVEEELDDTEYE